MRQNLNKSLELAHKIGHSKMMLNDISNEVNKVRRDAKNRN